MRAFILLGLAVPCVHRLRCRQSVLDSLRLQKEIEWGLERDGWSTCGISTLSARTAERRSTSFPLSRRPTVLSTAATATGSVARRDAMVVVAAAAGTEAVGRAVAAAEGAIPAEIQADDGTSLDHNKELFDGPAQAGLSFGGLALTRGLPRRTVQSRSTGGSCERGCRMRRILASAALPLDGTL